MTQASDSIEKLFDVQRSIVEQNRKFVEQTVEAQTQAARSLVESMGDGEAIGDRATEIGEQAVENYFDMLDEALDESQKSLDEARTAVTDAMGEAESIQADTWETVKGELERSLETYDELTQNAIAVFNDAVDSVLQGHEQVQERTVETAEQVEEQVSE
jgi:hypothetical protein